MANTDLVKMIADSISPLLKSRGLVIALLIVVLLVFVLGYLSRAAGPHDSGYPSVSSL